MAEKNQVLMMKLKVDLNCSKCYKNVKKALSKFPQIKEELFDEKSNTIIIKVVCCNPDKLMNKLCYKGNGSIKSIVILEPPKPAQAKPKEAEMVLAPAPALAPALAPQLVPVSQATDAYHCGPYYEAQQYECYRRPIYDSWGGWSQPQRCHEVTNQQSCSVM